MSYFPTDIPFMSDEELIENGLKKPYKKPEIIKGTDLVPVVRCKDCTHFQNTKECGYVCYHPLGCVKPMPYSFCSYGERREE